MKKLQVFMLLSSCAAFLLHSFFLIFAFYEGICQKYLYFSIDIKIFVFSLILSLVLPLGGLLCCVFANKGKQKGNIFKIIILMLSAVLIVLNVVSLPVSFYTVLWGDAGVVSSTENFANYGLYDPFVIKTLQDFSVENILPPKSQISTDSRYRYYANSYIGKKYTSDDEGTDGDAEEIICEYFKIELRAVFMNNDYFQQAVKKLENQQKKLETHGTEMNISWDVTAEQKIVDYTIEYIY